MGGDFLLFFCYFFVIFLLFFCYFFVIFLLFFCYFFVIFLLSCLFDILRLEGACIQFDSSWL